MRILATAADRAPGSDLLRAMLNELEPLYGRIDIPGAPTATPAQLSPPTGAFLVGWCDDGLAACCGGLKRLPDGACEIKRMYVVPAARGRGVAGLLLAALEDAARGLGYRVARLDTGPLQPHAQRLYVAAGYRPIEDFNGNPFASFWGEKALETGAGSDLRPAQRLHSQDHARRASASTRVPAAVFNAAGRLPPVQEESFMAVITRSALDASPLADLHALASTLGIDGFRRLRKADLADAILERQGGAEAVEEAAAEPAPVRAPRAPRRRRTAAATAAAATETGTEAGAAADDAPVAEEPVADEQAPAAAPAERKPRARRASRARREVEETPPVVVEDAPAVEPPVAPPIEEPIAAGPEPAERSRAGADDAANVVGVVELLTNGSGFLRVAPPDASDDDVYISAAQARRCELVSGDRVGGPVRRARRSERHPSLIRVETINEMPADEVVRGTRLEDLDAEFPTALLALGDGDPTLAAIGRFAPLGRGSRVVLAGATRSGKTEAIKRIAGALAAIEDLELEVLLVGVRPEELSEWKDSSIATVSGLTFAAPAEAQAAAVEQAVERGRRVAARGGDAVLMIDTLDGLHSGVARRALAAARKVRDGGSLTVIATATSPLGGETTVVTLDAALVARGQLPALDPIQSGTVRAELLVGLDGYQAIAKARAKA